VHELAPPVLRNKAIAAGATQWLDDLPDLLASLEAEWGFVAGAVYQGGTEALVAEADMHDGTDAVVKLLVPRSFDAAAHEITALRLANGHGCAQLIRSDEARGALLLERLGPSLYDLAYPIAQRHDILCATAARMWRALPTSDLPTGAEKGRWLAEEIVGQWEALDHPCSERTVTYALECAQRRIDAHDDERAVLVHGDVHQWNTLRAADGFKFVDPDGLHAEAEYDMGIVMREDPLELMQGDPHERSRMLAARTGLDEVAIWEWGVVERVSTGLLCVLIDLQPVGDEMLAAAEYAARY
jgi:streptomycin 6-kinase